MTATTLTCGWVDLPKCKRRCWFAHLPPPEALRNYVAIMDDFGIDLEMKGHKFQHLMIWELVHKTTERSTCSTPVDKNYHITALASQDMMTVGRFRAFALHVYINGETPRARYSCFSSTYTVLRRGNREKKVVDESKAIALASRRRIPTRTC